MPQKVTSNYFFGGWATVLIYDEHEMAAACGFTHEAFMHYLKSGRWGLCFHAHPLATGDQYHFSQSSFDTNVRIAECIRAGAHDYRIVKNPRRGNYGEAVCERCAHKHYFK